MGTNIKINICGPLPVTSPNVNNKSIPKIFLDMKISTNIIIYLVYKFKTVGGRSFLRKSRAI